MRKLTILAVVATLICGVVMVAASWTIPALCQQGRLDGSESCDVVTLLRGGVRAATREICRGPNAPASCPATGVAGLDRK